jgi:hypothetical protein
MLVNSIKEITLDTFKEAVYKAVTAHITSIAPLGYSSPTYLLYGNEGNERRCGVSVRNHSGVVSMLITDPKGSFIFHGGLNKSLPIDLIAKSLYADFKKVKKFINRDLPKNADLLNKVAEHPHYSSGFDILAMAQCSHLRH